MKKLYSYFKVLFVAAGLLTGANAWADAGDVTTNANIDFSNAITDGVVAGTVNSMTIGDGAIARNGDAGWLSVYDATSTVTIPEAQRAGSKDKVNIQFKTAWGNKNSMGFGFNLKDAEDAALASFQYARWDGNSKNANTLNINMSGLVGGHNSNKPIAARYTMFDITVDYAARTITSVVYCNNTDGKGTTKTETFTASLTNTNPIASFEIFGYNVGGNTDRANIFDDLIIKTTEGDYSVTTYDYTVNWVCNDNIIKTAIRQGEANAAITLFDTDKDPFVEAGTKYFYVSDNAAEKTVADDGSTVVTVNVREAETWNYTVQAVLEDETVLGTIATGTVVEGNSIYYYYPVFYQFDTSLLKADINDKTYGRGATPEANNTVYNVVYKEPRIENVVFYKECEEIEGLTAVTAGNVPARCSNGIGGMATKATTITTLAPGKYTISGFAWGNSGTDFVLTAAGKTVATFTTAASTVNVATSEEFTLTGTTDIVLGAQGSAGSSPKVLDFIYIQKTGDVELPATATVNVTAAGYATFTSAYDLDLATVNAYTATVDAENNVTFTKQTGKVVAGTGLLIKAAAGELAIPVATEGAAAVANNALIGVLADTEVAAGSFVLMNGAEGVGFYKAKNAFTVGANTAYIAALPEAGEARTFIALDGETTGISSVVGGIAADGKVYNLQGQRVAQPVKGLYIQNGKKVVLK